MRREYINQQEDFLNKEGDIKQADREMKKHLFSDGMRKLSRANLDSTIDEGDKNLEDNSPYKWRKQQLEDDIDAANEIIEYSPNKHIEEEEE